MDQTGIDGPVVTLQAVLAELALARRDLAEARANVARLTAAIPLIERRAAAAKKAAIKAIEDE